MSAPSIAIAGRHIGLDYMPLVVAEIGINHGGRLDVACAMVDAAVRAGAEIIKHQTHVLDDEMSAAARTVVPGNAQESIYSIMARCALSERDEAVLKQHVEARGAIFLSTPFSRAAADRLQRMGVQAFKVGSGECNNYPLLEHIATFGRPMILSTGMNDLSSVARAVEIFRRRGIPFALLHCTNVYPTPDEVVRLGCIRELAEAFPDAVVGLSDHTVDNVACLGAIACGASIVERHFTDDKCRPGPDIVCSMDPGDCGDLIEKSRRLWLMRGQGKYAVPQEAPTIAFAYASVVTIAPVARGERFSKANIWVKRPGTGEFLARDYESLLGLVASRDLLPDHLLERHDVEGWRCGGA